MRNPLPQFQKIITKDTEVDRLQTNLANTFNQLNNNPFLGGNLLQNVAVATGGTQITHGLNRQPQLWVLCDQNTNTTVWRTAWDTNTITLKCGSNCTINLWVN